MSAVDTLAGEFATKHRLVDPAEAATIAEHLYGMRGTLERFDTEKDDTFRLDADDGRQFVLKIAHPAEELGEIEFQVALLRHVQERDPSLPIPRVFNDRRGTFLPKVVTRGGESRLVRLMSYIRGTPLAQASSSRVQRESIGTLLARLRLAMADFAHPVEIRKPC